MKRLDPQIKEILIHTIGLILSLILAFLITRLIFRTDNFWIAALIASILSVVFDFIHRVNIGKPDDGQDNGLEE